jgi:NAD+ kinase
MVKSNSLPIFGINTDPARSVGHLTSYKIPFESRNKEIPHLMDIMTRENFKFIYKSRILVDKKDLQTNKSLKRTYALNEVFVAEKNVGASSIYRLKADGSYIGKFKSSGLLMCTGTGSTGWLQSAKRTTDADVLAGLNQIGYSREGE